MHKTHQQVIEENEKRLLKAMTDVELPIIRSLIHEDFVYIDENGQLFKGAHSLNINNIEILQITKIEIEEKTITFFDSVAIVNSVEKRYGLYKGVGFSGHYRLTRIWKFYGGWKLIAVTTVLI